MFLASQPRSCESCIPDGSAGRVPLRTSPLSSFTLPVSFFPKAYPLDFDILAHSLARGKTQLVYFQSVPHSLRKNTRGGGYPNVQRFLHPIRHRALHAIEKKQPSQNDQRHRESGS